MAINDARARERYERLRQMLEQSAKHIDWLSPFLTTKAAQSGDIAGMQVNARQHAEDIRAVLRFYDAEDKATAEHAAEADT
jgi:hypothetical protein